MRKAVFVAAFLALIVAFHFLDPYRALFFGGSRWAELAYHGGRLAFSGFFLVILFGLGRMALAVTRTSGIGALDLVWPEEFAMTALAGAAVLRVAMLVLGLLHGYSFLLAAALSLVAIVAAEGRLTELVMQRRGRTATRGLPQRVSHAIALLALCIAVFAVFVFKVLYPNGTGDYFSHYFPYYMEVTKPGGSLLNEVWYHFYLSKGDGDFFLGILLTDPLAPLAVSFAMVLLAVTFVWSFVGRCTGSGMAALLGATVTAAGLIWTFDTSLGFEHWAEFPKQHVIASASLFGSVWMAWRMIESPAEYRTAWLVLNVLCVVGTVVLLVQFAALYIIFVVILGAYVWWRYRRPDYGLLLPGFAAAVTCIAMLTLNYAVTGLAEVTPFRTFWRFADQERFSAWVSPFLMLLLDLGSSRSLGDLQAPDLSPFPLGKLLAAVFRVDRLAPYAGWFGFIAVATSALWIWSASTARLTAQLKRAETGVVALAAMLVAAGVAMMLVDQIGSLYRVYTFCIFPVVALGTIPLGHVENLTERAFGPKGGWATLAVAAICCWSVAYWILSVPPPDLEERLKFASGSISVADAYSTQNALWAPGMEARRLAGPQTKIWSSQITEQFCMAPNCDLETFFSYSMGKDWAAIMFEPADVARTALQREGLDYFLIDTNVPFFDVLPYSPLFSAEQIRGHLAVAWESNGVYLLTWPSSSTKPIDLKFDAEYTRSKELALEFADFPAIYRELGTVYAQWKKNPHWPVRLDASRLRPRGWQ